MTPREVAAEGYGIRVGDRVDFKHESGRLPGFVRRIKWRGREDRPRPGLYR